VVVGEVQETVAVPLVVLVVVEVEIGLLLVEVPQETPQQQPHHRETTVGTERKSPHHIVVEVVVEQMPPPLIQTETPQQQVGMVRLLQSLGLLKHTLVVEEVVDSTTLLHVPRKRVVALVVVEQVQRETVVDELRGRLVLQTLVEVGVEMILEIQQTHTLVGRVL
jgi:hypothetical protein